MPESKLKPSAAEVSGELADLLTAFRDRQEALHQLVVVELEQIKKRLILLEKNWE